MIHRSRLILGVLAAAVLQVAPLIAQSSISETLRNDLFEMQGPIMVFVAVEHTEVRVEMMVEAATLLERSEFELKNDAVISVDEQPSLVEHGMEFIDARFQVLIAGLVTKAGTTDADFLRIGDTESVIRTEIKDEPTAEAVVGYTYRFPVEAMPDYFQLKWADFPDGLAAIPCEIRVGSQTQEAEFSRYVPTIDWTSRGIDLQLPEIEPIKIQETNWLGRPKLDSDTAAETTQMLLENVYAAFEYTNEIETYDQLALSVSGEQLPQIYLEHRRLIEQARQGGPTVDIDEISVVDVGSVEKVDGAFEFVAEWDVIGTVTHFGHTHQRKNRYRAELTLVADSDVWKLFGIDLKDERRLQ